MIGSPSIRWQCFASVIRMASLPAQSTSGTPSAPSRHRFLEDAGGGSSGLDRLMIGEDRRDAAGGTRS
ncbi:MAG TPA: hypothetical protein VFQ44_20920 [Streptosporangiaceae bacterium]|nr:hypothetical protein [Streptosporangiaceae bacterium]